MTDPALRLLSLGAGVQSTTLALLSAAGELPKLDGAIFSDTGWEPAAVYRHLDRLETEILQPAGIPLYRVSTGRIQDDVLDPDKQRSLPAHTAGPWREITVVDRWVFCPDLDCPWARIRRTKNADLADSLPFFESLRAVPGRATLRELDALAKAFNAADDEGAVNHAREAAWTLRLAGLRKMPRPHEACNSTGRVVMASHTETTRDLGMLNRRCTQTYKLTPILRQVRLLLGATQSDPAPCRYCDGTGTRIAPWRAKLDDHTPGPCSICSGTGTITRVGQPAKGVWAEQWVGFSTDEIGRVSTRADTRYSKSRHPLLELNMSRTQCEAYLKHHGWMSVEKSACIGCPFHGNSEWRRMRDTDPESWAEAIRFDKAYRTGPGLRHQRFLHISRLPLDQAPIDKIRPSEWQQDDFFDAVYDAELAENGDPDGCSPYACRSGRAA